MPGTLCHRIGPGRLPGASRRDIGGGIAMATAATIAPALWYVMYASATVGGSPADWLVDAANVTIGLTVVFGAIVVPSAFGLGAFFWGRYVPETPSPAKGLLWGGATAYGCLVVVCLLIAALVAGLGSVGGGTSVLTFLGGILVLWALTTLLATLLAGWIVVPLGAAAGAYHELARRGESESAVDP